MLTGKYTAWVTVLLFDGSNAQEIVDSQRNQYIYRNMDGELQYNDAELWRKVDTGILITNTGEIFATEEDFLAKYVKVFD